MIEINLFTYLCDCFVKSKSVLDVWFSKVCLFRSMIKLLSSYVELP